MWNEKIKTSLLGGKSEPQRLETKSKPAQNDQTHVLESHCGGVQRNAFISDLQDPGGS